MRFIVICKNDERTYVLATRLSWRDRESAAKYAAIIAPAREAMVIECPRGLEFRDAN